MQTSVFRLVLAAGSTAAVLAAACSLVLDTSAEQCSVDGDCAKFGAARCESHVCVAADGAAADSAAPDAGGDAYDPVWGCLGHVTPPTFPKPMVNVSVPLVNLLGGAPVTAIDAKVCAKSDVACATPMGPTVNPNSQGILTFTLPAGFDGYVDMKSNGPVDDAGLPAYIPALVFFSPPLSQDLIYLTIPLLSPAALGSLAAQFGNTVDPTLGAPFAAVDDCQAKPAAGASVSIDKADASTRTFYFVNNLPTESTTQTDKSGYAGFINVPPGIRDLTAQVADGGAFIGKVSVLVRPSTITYTVLPPTP